jgi:polyhydroxyalkanoate synthesis regulator phasin
MVVGTPIAVGVYYCCRIRKTAQRVGEGSAAPGDYDTMERETADNVVAARVAANEVWRQRRRGNHQAADRVQRSMHSSSSGGRSTQVGMPRSESLPVLEPSERQPGVRGSRARRSAPAMESFAEPPPGVEGRDSLSSSSSRRNQSERTRRRRETEGDSEITAQDTGRSDNDSPRQGDDAGASTGHDWERQDPDQVQPAVSPFDVENQQRASDSEPVGRKQGGIFSKMIGKGRSRAPPPRLPQSQTPGASQALDATSPQTRRGSWTERMMPALFKSKVASSQATSDQGGPPLQSRPAPPDGPAQQQRSLNEAASSQTQQQARPREPTPNRGEQQTGAEQSPPNQATEQIRSKQPPPDRSGQQSRARGVTPIRGGQQSGAKQSPPAQATQQMRSTQSLQAEIKQEYRRSQILIDQLLERSRTRQGLSEQQHQRRMAFVKANRDQRIQELKDQHAAQANVDWIETSVSDLANRPTSEATTEEIDLSPSQRRQVQSSETPPDQVGQSLSKWREVKSRQAQPEQTRRSGPSQAAPGPSGQQQPTARRTASAQTRQPRVNESAPGEPLRQPASRKPKPGQARPQQAAEQPQRPLEPAAWPMRTRVDNESLNF